MTHRRSLFTISSLCLAFVLADASSGQAQEVIKLDTNTFGTGFPDWSGDLNSGVIGRLNGTISSGNAGNLTLNTDVSALGLVFDSGIIGPITINGSNNLNLGTSGLDLSNSQVNVTMNHGVLLNGNQTWNTGARDLMINGSISGSGNISKTGTGRIILGGTTANTYTGTLTLNAGPSGADVYALLLNKTPGVNAINGNVVSNAHGLNIHWGANHQVADTAVITINNGAKIQLNGYSDTIGGVTTSGPSVSVIQVVESGNDKVSTLTLQTAAGTTHVYNGLIRNSAAGTGNVLNLVKSGSGTQVLSNTGGNTVGLSHTGTTRIEGGTLELRANGDQNSINTWRSQIEIDAVGGINRDSDSRLLLNNSGASETLQVAITGDGHVTKTGAGTVRLSNTNSSYSGVTTIAGGILNVASVADYGVNSSLGNRASDTAVPSQNVGTHVGILFQGGTLQYTGSTAQSTNRAIRISTSGGTIDASGTSPSATLSFTALNSPDLFETSGTRTLTLTGTNTGNNLFDIRLVNEGANATSVRKTGTGTWVLRGTTTTNDDNSYSGDTTIQGGILIADGGAAIGNNSRVVVDSPGTFQLNANETVRSIHGGGNINLQGNRLTLGTGGSSLVDANFSGTISGTGGITKAGGGTQFLTGVSDYSGATILEGGILNVAQFSNYGVNGSLGNRPNESYPGGENRIGILFRGGTLQYTGNTAQTTNRAIRISTTGGAYIDASGSNDNATLNFTANSSPDFYENGGSRQLTLTGTNRGNNTFNLTITDQNVGGGGLTTVNKTGVGTWVLSGNSSYIGNTNVQEGTLLVNGNLGATPVIVNAGASFGGTGTLNGSLAVNGHLSPGGVTAGGSDAQYGVGTLRVNSNVQLAESSTALFGISGRSGNVSVGGAIPQSTVGGNHDRLLVSGSLLANGQIQVEFLDGFEAAWGDYFDLADFNSFSGTPDFDFSRAVLSNSLTWDTSLFSTHGVLQVVPEVDRALLMMIATSGLTFLRRRKI